MPATETIARCAAALSTAESSEGAARTLCGQVMDRLGAAPNLVFAFASAHHQASFDALADILPSELHTNCVLGCTAESIVGGAREVEGQPALTLWAAYLPGVMLLPMHLEFTPTADGGSFTGWHDDLGETWPGDAGMIALADPFSFPADVLLHRFNDDHPRMPIFGGMASGAFSPGENRLLLGGDVFDSGAVAVVMHGPVKLTSVVSQGCRPIGRPMVVTKAQQNVIVELGGRRALTQLQELFQTLTPQEQRLAHQGLHVGQVIDEYREGFARGDFLVRNVQGFDPDSGAIAIGDYARVGQTIQFHVRDAATADEDLHALLSAARSGIASQPLGALLFTCNGRGTRLFDSPNHDAGALVQYWKDLPLAGLFAAGEIGPVGGKNFVHGFTASIVLFSSG